MIELPEILDIPEKLIPVMTDLGKKTYDEIRIKTQEVFEKVHKMFPKAEMDKITVLLTANK